jgi:hypothetical protein
MTRSRLALISVSGALALLLVPVAFAGKPGGGGSCTRHAPGVAVDNTWAWGAWGSWGLPGQQLTYAINVLNYDVGCSASSFVVSMTAPSGFSVSMPTNTISLKSSASAYVWANVTSPSVIADGDYPLNVTVTRAGTAESGSFTSYYKVYSSDTVAPTLFWPSPDTGTTITGKSYPVGVSSTDDHAVRYIDLYIDDAYRSTAVCDGIAFTCQLYYTWSLRGVSGQHTATFKSYDWTGNVGVLTTTFNVG